MSPFTVSIRALPLLCLSVLLLAACGKAGMPVPKKNQDTFTITGAEVSAIGQCLTAQGTVTGAMGNFDKILFETDPVKSDDDCIGCPFVVSESQEYSAAEAQFDIKTGKFLLLFCPSVKAPMYRWRLVGQNIHLGLPHATTTPQIVMMESSGK